MKSKQGTGAAFRNRKLVLWGALIGALGMELTVPALPQGNADLLSVARNLGELIDHSELVIEGNVQAVFPPALLDPYPALMVTDAHFTVTRVLKGPRNISQFVVSQSGAPLQTRQANPPKAGEVNQTGFVQLGERYIVFATSTISEERKRLLPVHAGLQRYELVAGRTALIQLNNSKVVLNDQQRLSAELARYHGTPESSIVAAIETHLTASK
jgi:hypothetical protein